MKFITDPKVYMVGRQQVVNEEVDTFLADHNVSTWETDTDVAGQKLSEIAGRVCYMSFAKPRPGGNHAYLDNILESFHGSVIENTIWNFIITNVSRTFTHELVRHRAGWGYSQRSQRYVDESEAEFIIPPDLRDEVEAALYARKMDVNLKGVQDSPTWIASHDRWNKYTLSQFLCMATAGEEWLQAIEKAQKSYVSLSNYLTAKVANNTDIPATDKRKFARQAARSVLPNATETKIFVTVNARALRHFIEMRASRWAEPEIRKVAVSILHIMQKEAPNLFGDYKLIPLPDGTFEAQTEYRKV
jgi:thymidylate synthase (FAD)